MAVSSARAVAAVVKRYHGDESVDRPVVLFTERVDIESRHAGDDALLAEYAGAATRRALDACRAWLAAHHGGAFETITCAIGEPWIATIMRTVHIEKPKPISFTQKMIDEAVVRDRKVFEAEISDRATAEVEIVQAVRMAYDINGYRVADPVGEQGSTCDIHMAYALASAAFLEELTVVGIDVFHRDDMRCVAADIARAQAVPETVATLILDMGGSSASLAAIDRGVITQSIVIPMGMTMVIEHLTKLFDAAPASIGSVMVFATDEKLLEHERDEYYRRIELAYRPLGILIERTVDELRRIGGEIPETVVVTGIPAWGSVFYPMIAASMKTKIVLPDFMNEKIVYAHGVSRDIQLSAVIDMTYSRV